MTSLQKVLKTHDSSDDYTADDRAPELREDFDELRKQIENHPTMSGSKKDRLLEKIEGCEKLLIKYEDDFLGDEDNRNDVGLESGDDRNFDLNNVLRREFNLALEGYHEIADQIPDVPDASKPESLKGTIDPDCLDAIDDVDTTDVDPPSTCDDADGPAKTDDAGGGGSGSGDSIGSLEFDGMSVDGMLNTLNDDPQAVMEHIQGLDEEDKQMAMQMLQQHLQQINQMFSMLSNLAKTQHDTAKAAINNMRV